MAGGAATLQREKNETNKWQRAAAVGYFAIDDENTKNNNNK